MIFTKQQLWRGLKVKVGVVHKFIIIAVQTWPSIRRLCCRNRPKRDYIAQCSHDCHVTMSHCIPCAGEPEKQQTKVKREIKNSVKNYGKCNILPVSVGEGVVPVWSHWGRKASGVGCLGERPGSDGCRGRRRSCWYRSRDEQSRVATSCSSNPRSEARREGDIFWFRTSCDTTEEGPIERYTRVR